jgi:hypothetical protein
MDSGKCNVYSIVLAAAFVASEVMGTIKVIPPNGLLDFFIMVVRRVVAKRPTPAELPIATAEAILEEVKAETTTSNAETLPLPIATSEAEVKTEKPLVVKTKTSNQD